MELYGCSGEGSCFVPLGVEDGRVPGQFFSASSIASNHYKAEYSRLNSVASGARKGAWAAKVANVNQWLQVDLGRPSTVTKIVTQGRQDALQYVQSYKVSYSFDGSHWTYYRLQDGHVEVFGGNADKNSLQFNHFSPAIHAKFIRIHPLTWVGHISMRFELYGCYMVNNCLMPLGVEDGRVLNAELTASSIHSALYAAHFGRLNLVKTKANYGAWCAKVSNAKQWIQIEFNEPTVVTKIATQGRQDVAHWVKSYNLEYSYNAQHWAVYKHNSVRVVFPGNFDQHTIREHHIFPAIYARFLRVRPLTWHGFLCMRFEVYGCAVNGIGDMTVTAF
ncbi:EGF-like repeat and discoidin I-like domain-containing protein 3 isoform X2 [Actinia tenebrosa]|uniref:EGF-like repeat and discoidin I-like domain-containing protein 3 isoform X2 n=1 Tax=Actinia tenebrosa TaxID=6105 RepID=A0A6P8IHN6_ACTTE|nr:EGF-like repeat and discoidin I-like domain-containing protein 3 isoform X2 [Actinia tenebrosa]